MAPLLTSPCRLAAHNVVCRIDSCRRPQRDLGYAPIIPFGDGWADTLEWFKANWLPTFDDKMGIAGLHKGTEAKIRTQVEGTAK